MTNRVRMRDDDVLLTSSGHSNPFDRFRRVHSWIAQSDKAIHVPAILVTEIQQFPDCIEFVKFETKCNKMDPQLHGLAHVDYGALDETQVFEDISKAKGWMEETFKREVTHWYTPWGANQPHLHSVGDKLNLKVIGVDRTYMLARVCRALSNGASPESLMGHEVFFHWWEGGLRALRLIKTLIHGGWENAREADPKLFK